MASDSIVAAGPILSAAFNVQGITTDLSSTCPADCGNIVGAVGPLSVAGAINVFQQSVSQSGPGITIATPFNDTGSNTNVLAAGGTQRNLFRPSLNASLSRPNVTSPGGSILRSVSDRITTSTKKFSPQGSLFRPSLNATPNDPKATSPGGSVLKSVSDRITTSTKKFSDAVSRVAGGLAGRRCRCGQYQQQRRVTTSGVV